MTRFTTALAALAIASTLAPAALADTTFSRETAVEVKIADLDLTTSTGAQRLLTRIQDAAKEACSEPDSAIRNMARKCRDSIVEYNVARLNIHTLAVAYNDAYGKTLQR